MPNSNFLYSDGQMLRSDKALILPDNRSFRYGDGFFETMKLRDGQIQLADYHFERLFKTLDRLKFQPPSFFTKNYLETQIHELVKKNGHHGLARIRLTIYRGEGGIYDRINHFPHHLIQTWDLNESNNHINENGLVVGVYPDAKKVCDGFSHLKTNNYLNYAMAAIWAKENHLNDAFLLNPYQRLADATIANVFIVKEGIIKTPALAEGPVEGVMRRHLMTELRKKDITIIESNLDLDEILEASEIFLTNAIYGIRWVKQLESTNYQGQMAHFLFKTLFF
jgi:branched-subunit amino acid aminotransferase/4-amino-4-deoxychorismate lyase